MSNERPKPEFFQSSARIRSVSRLPNRELVQQLQRLNQQKLALDAELLLHLSELDQRRLYREQACSSAFEFCVSRLGYSEDVAFKRVGASRMLRQFPLIYQLLAEGRIHLTALMLLKPHLTEANHEEWLLLACEKSKRQVEKLVASRCPQPDVPASVRRLPQASTGHVDGTERSTASVSVSEPAATARLASSTPSATLTPSAMATPVFSPAPSVKPAPTPAVMSRLVPLSSWTYRVTFTANEALKQKLDRASELLSHCIQPSDLPALFERALDQLIAREEQRRFAVRSKHRVARSPVSDESRGNPRGHEHPDTLRSGASPDGASPDGAWPHHRQTQESCRICGNDPAEVKDPDPAGITNSPMHAVTYEDERPEHGEGAPRDREVSKCSHQSASRRTRPSIAAAVRRAVWERDGGQCTFVDQSGRRCSQRHFLELDHIEAFAIGGAATASNLRLRCRSHNAFEAEALFGRRLIDSAITLAARAYAAR